MHFHLGRSVNDLENQNLQSKICSFWLLWGVIFGHLGGRKSRIIDFFKVVWELFRKSLGILFGLKRPTFGFIFSSKGPLMSPKIENFSRNLSVLRGLFWPIWGWKKSFSGLFQSCFGVLRKCLGIVFGVKRPTFLSILSPTLHSLPPIPESLLWGPAKP